MFDMEPINVLSLFDGGSCGQYALKKQKIPVANYFASEINKYATEVANHNFPNTVQLGDVQSLTKEKLKSLPKIDLVMGGSPCQGFSFSGKRLNFDDPRSKLFFEFHRIVRLLQPKWFLLENVPMGKKNMDVISDFLGTKPLKLNSRLTSAQNRVRLYWCNFDISQPKDANISLYDILESTKMHRKPLYKASIKGRRLDDRGKRRDGDKSFEMVQCLEVSNRNMNKNGCLTTVSKDTVLTPLKPDRYADVYNKNLPYRNLTIVERCRLMNLPDDYCCTVSNNQAIKITGNGWETGMIGHILSHLK